MAHKTVYTCDRCKGECLGVQIVDLGNDYTKGDVETAQVSGVMPARKERVNLELCIACWKDVRDFATLRPTPTR